MVDGPTEILKGRRILIVEDEMLLAMDVQELLEENGCHVLGPVPSVERAMEELAAQTPDAVSLDLNLNGESSAPIAAALIDAGIPFLVVSGYGNEHADDPVFQDAPFVGKPYDTRDYIQKLSALLK